MRGHASRRRTDRFPPNARPPLAFRLLGDRPDATPADPHARDPRLARLEAALFLASEPLTARKLATAAALADSAEGAGSSPGSASCTTPTPPRSRSRRSPADSNS